MTTSARTSFVLIACLGTLTACVEAEVSDTTTPGSTDDPQTDLDAGGLPSGTDTASSTEPPNSGTDTGTTGDTDTGGANTDTLATDTGDTDPNTDTGPDTGEPVNAACQAAVASAATDFESGAGAWTHGIVDDASHATWPLDPWEYGAASGPGPGSCFGGSGSCFATYLTQNYLLCQRGYLQSPVFDLTACAGETLTVAFRHHYTFWQITDGGTTYYDGGIVEFSSDGGTTWSAPSNPSASGTVDIFTHRGTLQCIVADGFRVDGKTGYVGSSGAWETVEITIPTGMLTNRFAVRFAFSSGLSSDEADMTVSRGDTEPGWYIDDFSIEMN